MAVVEQGIEVCSQNGFCFGNYEVKEKLKIDQFEHNGDIYKLRTYNKATRLEKNDKLLIESVPGTAIHGFSISAKVVSFKVEGSENSKITLELEPETDYSIFIDDQSSGAMKTSLSGKITFNVDLTGGSRSVQIKKN